MIGFKLEKLDKNDLLVLSSLCLLILLPEFLNFTLSNSKDLSIVVFFLSFIISYATVSTPLGLRFRNFYFSLIWLILCLKLYFIDYQKNIIAIWPLTTFCSYQIVRTMYWLKFKREFIPLWITSSVNLRYSELENRQANGSDQVFMIVLFLLGLSSLFVVML